jgi:hypothetical protein
VSKEWEVLAEYVAEVTQRAPRALQSAVERLRIDFASAEAARQATNTLFNDLLRAGALTPAAKDVWTEHHGSFQRQWRDLLSETANLDMRVRLANRRKKTSTIDYEKDLAVARSAALERMLSPGRDLKSLIMEAAQKLGANLTVDDQSYYQRIKRIIADPRERIESGVLIGLKEAMDKIQNPPTP